MTRPEFINKLPPQCQNIRIEPKKKIALKAFFLKNDVWIILLTDQPAKSDMAWQLTYQQWKNISPKHTTKIRYVRENLTPLISTEPNPPKPRQTQLPF